MTGRTRNLRIARAGFTLIEVLATLMLLAIVLPVVLRGVQLALHASSTARHTAQAASLAETKLNDLLMQSMTSATGTSGDFAPQFPDYRWTYQTAPRDYGVNEVQLRVTWLERGQEYGLNLGTLIYPTGSTTGATP